MAEAERDGNFVPTLLGVSNADGTTPIAVYADPTTHRLLVDLAGGAGTVTSVSVVTANGFAGTVATSTTTPAITLSTTVTGVLKGNGTAISAASAGTDYVAPGAITTSGLTQTTARLLGRTTAGTGAVEEITVGSGLTFAAGTLSATGGAGDVVGPASATDNALVRFDTTTGKLIQNSGAILDDSNNLSGLGTVASGAHTITSTSANALAVGANGTTNPVLKVDASTATVATGVSITGAAATGRVAIGVLSSGVNEGLSVDAKGSGTIRLGATSTGDVEFSRNAVPTASDGSALGTTALMWSDLFLASGGVINWNNGNATLTHSAGLLTSNVPFSVGTSNAITAGTIELGAATDTTISRSAAGQIAVEGVQVATVSNTVTLTNKRNQPRTASSTSAATLDPDLSTANVYYRTTQTVGLTIGAPTGTPVIGETIAIYVDSAASQTLTINATYVAFGSAFPASTTAGKTFMMVAQYDGTNWKTTWANAV